MDTETSRFPGKTVAFLIGGLAGALAIVALQLVPSGASYYKASCIIELRRSDVAAIYAPDADSRPLPDVEEVRARMLGYEAVMEALVNTAWMAETETTANGDPARLAMLRDKLYTRVKKNLRFKPLGKSLVKITYRDSSPLRAAEVLNSLVNQFVETRLKREQVTALRARKIALKGYRNAEKKLETVESMLVALHQDHPRLGRGDLHAELAAATETAEELDRAIAVLRYQIGRLEAQLKDEASDDKKKALAKSKVELEDRLEGHLATRRAWVLRLTRLREELRALPGLQKELYGLKRDKQAAERRYQDALDRFERADRVFNMVIEGLVSVSVVVPARAPIKKEPRPGLLKRLLD